VTALLQRPAAAPGACLIAGALATLAFAPFHLPWFAPFPLAAVLWFAAGARSSRAAAACGLKTAYVPRPLERGPGGVMEPWTPGEFDVVAGDFVALAGALGA
jgi:hypothetical protein